MICAVVGGQFGSEAKGHVAGHLAGRFGVHVRVGAANAGHTVWARGQRHVLQQLPVAVYAHPEAVAVIGPGALISPEIMAAEWERNRAWRERHGLAPLTLLVDERAHLITDRHIAAEAASGLSQRIGSTSATAQEGIGEAEAARVLRDEDCVLARDARLQLPPCEIVDVPSFLARSYRHGILLEGTQGTGLSLHTGLFPYVTSRDTTASGLCAQAGISARELDRVVMVCRTFPIRVAGNSGPFWAPSREISWADIGVDEDAERTTVTGKIRRVATFSVDQALHAANLNGATDVALTFCDYLDGAISDEPAAGSVGLGEDYRRDLTLSAMDRYPAVRDLVDELERRLWLPVRLLGAGPDRMLVRESRYAPEVMADAEVSMFRLCRNEPGYWEEREARRGDERDAAAAGAPGARYRLRSSGEAPEPLSDLVADSRR